MKIQTIRESDFNALESIKQVIFDDHARRFAVLDIGNNLGHYGLAWQSELVDPIVEVSLDGKTVWIGVDQQLIALCLNRGRIRVALKLNTNILEILTLDKFTVVLTETELMGFNSDLSISLFKGLPDLVEGISIVGSDLTLKFLEGYSLILNAETGNLSPPKYEPIKTLK